jgi:hypothetical protein
MAAIAVLIVESPPGGLLWVQSQLRIALASLDVASAKENCGAQRQNNSARAQ